MGGGGGGGDSSLIVTSSHATPSIRSKHTPTVNRNYTNNQQAPSREYPATPSANLLPPETRFLQEQGAYLVGPASQT